MLLSGSRNLKVVTKSRKGRKQNAHHVKSTTLFTITANGETHRLLLLMTDTFFYLSFTRPITSSPLKRKYSETIHIYMSLYLALLTGRETKIVAIKVLNNL